MAQSRKMSWVETFTNTVGGLAIALVCQVVVFKRLGIAVAADQNVIIIAVMMVQSFVRQLTFRRFFNWLETRNCNPE